MNSLSVLSVPSPIGPITLAASARGLAACTFGAMERGETTLQAYRRVITLAPNASLLNRRG